MDKLKSLLRSRRVWVAAASVIVVALNEMGLDVEKEMVESVVLLAVAWILGDSLRKTE